MTKDYREEYEKETGLNWYDDSEFKGNGNYPVSYEFMEWLSNRLAKTEDELLEYERKFEKLTGGLEEILESDIFKRNENREVK